MDQDKKEKLAEKIKKLKKAISTLRDKKEVDESRIMDRDALINAFYVSPEGKKHRVAEKIPYYLLDKLVGLLTKKYNITMNDIEVRPADQDQYRRSSHPDLAEDTNVAQPGQLVSIIQAPKMLDLLPGETFEVRSSDENGVTLKHGMGTKFDNVVFPHGTYKIVNAQGMKEGIFGGLGGPASGPMLAKGGPGYAGLSGASKLRHDASVAMKMVDSLKQTNHNGYYDEEIKKKLLHAQECLAKAKELEQRLDETKVSKYKDLGATNATTHFIKNVTTGEIVSPHRGKQDAEDALVALYRGPSDGNEYKIVRARKEVDENFDAQEFHRHMEKLRAREELRKTDPMRALVGDLIDKENEKRTPAKNPEDDSININDPRHPSYGALHNPLSLSEDYLDE